ncbi:MAG: HEAT repeat domain-containing protein [Planctomycetes bacterium]|nr:HEAT repeat domain-containing protein [Planctomycetota bacterium]
MLSALAEALDDPDEEVFHEATAALAGLDASARDAIPALIRSLRRGAVIKVGAYGGFIQQHAGNPAHVLAQMGELAVSPLIEALHNDNEEVRWGALAALTFMDPPPVRAIPSVVRTLTEDSGVNVRWRAVVFLAHLKSHSEQVVLALAGALKDEDHGVRLQATIAVGHIGEAAAPAVSNLIPMLSTEKGPATDAVENMLERFAAANALVAIGPGARAAIPAFLDVIKSGDRLLFREAAKAFQRIDPDNTEIVPALVDSLNDSNVRASALSALAILGPVAAHAIPAIRDAVTDPSMRVRVEAAMALANVADDLPTAVPVLMRALAPDCERDVRYSAAEALGEMGPRAALAIPALIGLLNESDYGLAQRAAWSLEGIGIPAALVELLDDAVSEGFADTRTRRIVFLLINRLLKPGSIAGPGTGVFTGLP